MVKKLLQRIRTSIWLYPGIYSVFSLALAVSVSMVDTHYSEEATRYLFDFLFINAPRAETILGIVAGSFITIATFTFSTTMIVLTMYSSQFTPRVVENFLNNEITMKSFGVFLSGFTYAITSLLFLRKDSSGDYVIAASIAVIYVIVGLIYFLVFIQNVTSHIQANGLIMRLQKDAREKIETYCEFIRGAEVIGEEERKEMLQSGKAFDVMAPEDGYIQSMDYPGMKEIAQRYNATISIDKVIGQFVSTERRIMKVYLNDESAEKEEIMKKINEITLIGSKKTEEQDFPFTIQKIVEIALKALSPGINDPNTAIHCLHILGLLLRDLSRIEKGYIRLNEEDREGSLLIEGYEFDILLYDAFSQIIHYGQEDSSVMVAVFKSLKLIKDRASEENIDIIESFGNDLMVRLDKKGFSPSDLKYIQNEHRHLKGN